jgi:hypothetical protein
VKGVEIMKKLYHWEIQPTEEVKPHFIYTETDSVAEAVKQFEEAWGDVSIMYIRKIAVIEQFEYEDDFREVSWLDFDKRFAAKEFLALVGTLHTEISTIEKSSEDDDLDSEYKRGAKDAFLKSVDLIYEHAEKLVGEFEQN